MPILLRYPTFCLEMSRVEALYKERVEVSEINSDFAIVSPESIVHPTARIWAFAEIREGAVIGENVIIGSKVYIGVGVTVGANCKIQNNSLVYEPAVIEPGVFIGPGVILTNDKNPRAINENGKIKNHADWNPEGVHIGYGASIGAGTVCVGPLSIGEWALVGAGSVVTRDVKDFELVGGVPARHLGWVGQSGFKLQKDRQGYFVCPKTFQLYSVTSEHNLVKVPK